jgi:hypothetical protein
MRLKLLYTLVLLFCMSAFASSNQSSGDCRNTHVRIGATKGIQTASEDKQESGEAFEGSPIQVIKFLYI